jgi:hypothetical protein
MKRAVVWRTAVVAGCGPESTPAAAAETIFRDTNGLGRSVAFSTSGRIYVGPDVSFSAAKTKPSVNRGAA